MQQPDSSVGRSRKLHLDSSSGQLLVLGVVCALVIFMLPVVLKRMQTAGGIHGRDRISFAGTGVRKRVPKGASPIFVRSGETVVVDYQVTIREGVVDIVVFRVNSTSRIGRARLCNSQTGSLRVVVKQDDWYEVDLTGQESSIEGVLAQGYDADYDVSWRVD